MEDPEIGCCVFPLTSLQIGDLQSYLSNLSLFLATESKKMYILVDNRPWVKDLCPRREQLWQYMVTKSRMSPFANNKAHRERKEGKNDCSPELSGQEVFSRWISLMDATRQTRKRILLPVKQLRDSTLLSNELHETLYGFIIFEVEWSSVRGINYANELQTDTCLAIEAKYMRRWEFDSIAQAASSISSWFSGALSEQLHMKEYLESIKGDGFHDANEDISESVPIYDEQSVCSDRPGIEDSLIDHDAEFDVHAIQSEKSEVVESTPTLSPRPVKRRQLTRYFSTELETDSVSEVMDNGASMEYSEISACTSEGAVEGTEYRDVLIMYRFNDPDLPFKLREVIMSDLRLLTLLEAGLPSWALVLQSYPVLCRIYQPWMCPLVRALYVLISIVTVLIGFYDLYKNVPVLKATAYRLCGPFFDWIETWDMVSRIKYLGTILFLQHFQRAMRWFLSVTQTCRSFFSVLARPLMEPLLELFGLLLPLRNVLFDVLLNLFSIVWLIIEFSYNVMWNKFFSPLSLLFKFIWTLVNSILYPILWMTWEILFSPVRIALALSGMVAFVFRSMYNIIGKVWQCASTLFHLASPSEAAAVKVTAYEVSMWRSLWNDIFSQVFRALRSILKGFVAFFAACNRHRLSIYNHIVDFIHGLYMEFIESVYKRSHDAVIKQTRARSMSPTVLILDHEKDEVL